MNKAEGILTIIAFWALVALIPIGMWAFAFGIEYFSCATRANKMGFNYSMAPFQGCMIEYKPNQWVDINKFRVVD